MADVNPDAVVDAQGNPIRRQTKEEMNARYKVMREKQLKARAERLEYKAKESAKPLEQKMRESGRTEAFIQEHKNDTPAMQAAYNAAKKKGTQAGHAVTDSTNHTRPVK